MLMRQLAVRRHDARVLTSSGPNVALRCHLLTAALFAGLAIAVAVMVGGGVVIALDAAESGEMYDGLGIFLGGMILAGGAILAAVHLALWALVRSGLRLWRLSADDTRLRAAALICALLGLPGSALLVACWLLSEADLVRMFAPILTAVAITITGCLVFAGTDRPGGSTSG